MKKIIKSIKPFWGLIGLSIVLLFVQAFSDLQLPNYMSQIVNVGIQQSGIEHASPEVLSKNGFQLVQSLLPEKQALEFANFYTLDGDVYRINDLEENRHDADILVGESILTLMNLELSDGVPQGNPSDDGIKTMDLEKLFEAIPYFQMLDKTEAYAKASKTQESIKLQTGVMFARLLYEDAGKDSAVMQRDYILNTGLLMLGVTLISVLAAISVSFVSSKVGAGFSRNLRGEIFTKVEGFSNVEFNEFSSSSLVIRTTNDVTQVQQMIIMGIRIFFYAPIMAIGGIMFISRNNTSLTWIIVAACLAISVLLVFVSLVAVPKFKIVQQYIDRLTAVFRENLNGVMVIRAFGNKEFERKRFAKANADSADLSRFINRIMSAMMPIMMFVMNLTMIGILWFGAREVSTANLQIGDLMAFMQYSMQIIMSFLMISMMFIFVPRAVVSLNRIKEVLDTKNKINDPKEALPFDMDKMGYVEFKNVSFKYEGAAEPVLKDISFTAKPNQTTAIIGSTGSGKSTLVNLIPRFFEVSGGSISVNGVDVRDMKQHDLRELIGFIPQKGYLLSGSARSNNTYGYDDASDEEILQALETSQAGFILDKEGGLDMEVSQGGTNFSGGQKQRLSIARALIKKSKIFIFDDSFSALDFKTDQKLRHAIKENLKGSNLIIVAQRVNTILDADQIIVLDQGVLVGIGTHKELLKSSPTYYDIASSQMSAEELSHE